jgi:hypothetical protein
LMYALLSLPSKSFIPLVSCACLRRSSGRVTEDAK